MNRNNLDFQEEEIILIEKATKRKKEEHLKKVNTEKAYQLRKTILTNYFIRMSNVNKLKYIQRIFNNFDDFDRVSEIANYMSFGDLKPMVYSLTCHQTNFKHDMYVVDHNRCLSEKELEEVLDNDEQWLKTLTIDQQVDIIFTLMKVAGGSIKKILYFPMFKKCLRKNSLPKFEKRNPVVSTSEIILTHHESVDTAQFFDHPATIEVENLRRNWNTLVSKYKDTVQSFKPSSKDKVKAKSTNDKTKQSKKGDKGTDWIQLLPVWSVKKIFNYLDQNTLQKVKKVNPYWSYIAQDVIKEKKLRAELNKEIEKMKAEISSETLTEVNKMEELKPIETKRKSTKTRRRLRKYERGCIMKSLVPKPTDTLVQTSLHAEVVKEISEGYFTENIASFPREVGGEKTIYKYQPCFLRDVQVVLGDQEDVNENRSFVTYSMETKTTSLTLTVDRQTLDEW